MKDISSLDLRSEEVQEILGTPPSWIVRWGTTAAFAGLLVLIFSSWLIRIPESLPAEVEIKSTNEPVRIKIGPEDKNFTILVADKDTVKMGNWVAYRGDDAKLTDIYLLEAMVDSMKNMSDVQLMLFSPGRQLQLGELQIAFTNFLQEMENFKSDLEEEYGFNARKDHSQEILTLRRAISNERARLKSKQKTLTNTNKYVKTLMDKYTKSEVSYPEYMREKNALEALEDEVKGVETSILDKEVLLRRLEKGQAAMNQETAKEEKNKKAEVMVRLEILEQQVKEWKRNHLIIAPVDGWVNLPSEYKPQTLYVNSGKEILSIIPFQSGKTELEAEARMAIASSGKVQPGQEVVINLEGYPADEFGFIKGEVKSKPVLSSNKETLLLELGLPRGLETSKGKDIKYEFLMKGKGEVIIENKRFLHRLFEDFWNMIT